ncbi:glucan biosynthesis protein [Halopseudomonas pachastrellae]|nr:glucan biosynthesis protein [Halopseudomonas pachastrellae]
MALAPTAQSKHPAYGLLQRAESAWFRAAATRHRLSQLPGPGSHLRRAPQQLVETDGSWGPGKVVLVQIPTPNETNDNIVAFWQPNDPVERGKPLKHRYRVLFGDHSITANPLGRAHETVRG